MAKATKNISLAASDVYGIVKWFNKGTGRITIKDYGDVFVHFSQIKKPSPKCYNPQKFLVKGQTVKCDLLSGPKGLQARKVIVVIDTLDDDKRSVTSDIPDSSSVCEDYYEETSSDSGEDEPSKAHNILERDLRGEVISYFIARGFGFVKTHQYGNIFCHNSDIIFTGEDTSLRKLVPTQFVKCDVARGPKGLMAVNVHVICEASPVVETGASHANPAQKSRDSSASRQQKKNEGSTKAPKQAKPEKHPKQEKSEKQPKKESTKGGMPQQAALAKTHPKPKGASSAAGSNLSTGDPAGSPVLHADVLGEVLHYNPLKGFGFIKVPIHGSVFVHKNSLIGCETLQKGQYVKFDIVRGPKTLMAINLTIISDSTFKEKGSAEKKNELEPKTEESKAKKKKKTKNQTSSVPQLMSQPAPGAVSSEKPPLPMAPPSAPPMNPDYPPASAPNYPCYPYPPVGSPMHMPGPPHPHVAFGPPPPYMAPPPQLMRPSVPPRTMNPPPYPGQMAPIRQMLGNTHITATKDPFAKPQDPKASSDRRLHEGVTQELTCGICEDLLEDPVITPCEHLFCRGCLLEWLPYNAQCPIDREPLSKEVMKDAPKVIKNLLCKT